jgi:anti-sigma factor RsiW
VETDSVHQLTAAYALHALDDREVAEYEAHLARCSSCQDELASLQGTAALLALGAPAAEPSPGLRGRILDQARAERPNVVPHHRRRLAPVLGAAAAIAAGIAVVLGIWASSLSSDLDGAERALDAQRNALALATETGAKQFPLQGASGTLVVAPSGEAALVIDGLGAAPEGKVYEAWVSADGKTMTPAGTFSAGDGTTAVVLDRPVPEGGLAAVTVEDGPVDQPTGMPILTAPTT